jgi:hypothetical protein
LAVVWGERVLGKAARKSCWLIGLHTAEIEDLLTRSDEKTAAIVRDSERVTFSPDGTHLLISMKERRNACIVDLSTRKSVVISRPEPFSVLWIGNRLLLSSWEHAEICDVAGKLQEPLKLRGDVVASDPTGTKLLLRLLGVTVVNSGGEVLRRVGDGACDREAPLLSRSGNWAGIYCHGRDGWAYSVVSTTTDKVFRLKRPWGATLALTDNGDSIFAVRGGNSTFDIPRVCRQRDRARAADIVFWPRDEALWKSAKGAPAAPSSDDDAWNALQSGKSQIVARNVMAIAVLGDELFVVEARGDERILKAIAIPKLPPPATANK